MSSSSIPTNGDTSQRTEQSLASQEPSRSSRSRSRRSFTRGAATHTARSCSRASFLGRPRQRTYEVTEEHPDSGSSGTATRYRSESRTVRGSVDEDGYVFTDDEAQSGQPTKTTSSNHKKQVSQPPSPTSPPQDKQTSAPSANNEKTNGDIEGQGSKPHPPRLSKIPYPLAHFLGYRTKQTENRAIISPLEKLPRKLEALIWAWIGAMLGLGFVMLTFSRWDKFSASKNRPVTPWTAPIIIGSFGASSVILYGAPASPLGQPKSFMGGQFISALTGVIITKLFALNSHYDPELIDSSHSLVWVAGGIAVGTALIAMMLTDTVHPPGGATALLAATSPPVVRLGWHYLPVVLLSCVIMLSWAMLWMNLGRARYPTFWIEPSATKVSLASLGLRSRNKAQ